jgi:hypothetical protein
MLVSERSQLLLRRGFEVVPDLIGLCEDRRITVPRDGYEQGNPSDRFERLGELAKSALVGISGYHPRQALSVDMPDDVSDLDAAFWNDWWRQAEAQGERGYYIRNFFVVAQHDVTARQVAAEVLAYKHRDALIHIGEEYLAVAPRSVPRLHLAQAINGLSLRPETKVEMLSDIAQHCPPLERRAVLREMADVGPQRAIELLIQLFDELPADTRGFGQEASMNTYPKMDLILSQPKLSRAYLAAARRNKSLRMELISRLAYWYASDQERLGRLALLSAFLDDETPRDRSLLSERFFSDDFVGITVRDFAAMHSAKLLGIEAQPNQEWTPEQWSTLRDQVRERLKQEKLPVLE